jgi:hypothetical protein
VTWAPLLNRRGMPISVDINVEAALYPSDVHRTRCSAQHGTMRKSNTITHVRVCARPTLLLLIRSVSFAFCNSHDFKCNPPRRVRVTPNFTDIETPKTLHKPFILSMSCPGVPLLASRFLLSISQPSEKHLDPLDPQAADVTVCPKPLLTSGPATR